MKILFFVIITVILSITVFAEEGEENCSEDDCVDTEEPLLKQKESVYLRTKKTIKTKSLEYDIALFSGMILLLTGFVYGSLSNRSKLKVWKKKCFPNILDNVEKQDILEIKVSNGENLIFIKNKDSNITEETMIKLQFTKIHNLFEYLIDLYNFKSNQSLTISIKPKNNTNFVFAIVKREKANEYRRSRSDLNLFTKQYTLSSLDEKYVCLSEHIDLHRIIDNKVSEYVKKLDCLLHGVICSDQPIKYPSSIPVESIGIIDIEYKLKLTLTTEETNLIREFNNYITHKITSFKVNSEATKKTTKNRTLIYEPLKQKTTNQQNSNNQNINNQPIDKDLQKKREERAKKRKAKKSGTKIITKS